VCVIASRTAHPAANKDEASQIHPPTAVVEQQRSTPRWRAWCQRRTCSRYRTRRRDAGHWSRRAAGRAAQRGQHEARPSPNRRSAARPLPGEAAPATPRWRVGRVRAVSSAVPEPVHPAADETPAHRANTKLIRPSSQPGSPRTASARADRRHATTGLGRSGPRQPHCAEQHQPMVQLVCCGPTGDADAASTLRCGSNRSGWPY